MKKVFNELFKQTIIPFSEQFGFERHTKTSKRLLKKISNELTVVIYFEHKNFGYGSYSTNIVYYEKIPHSIERDDYLASINFSFPYSSNLMIDCQNEVFLSYSVQYWIRVMELYILPFINKNKTIASIKQNMEKHISIEKKRLELGIKPLMRKPAYSFYIPKSKEEKFT